jgi:hypothetical protein
VSGEEIIGHIPVILATRGPLTTDEVGAELDAIGQHHCRIDVLATLLACEAIDAVTALRSSSAGGSTLWAVRDL